MRVWRTMKNDPIAAGKNANTPEKYEPIELLAVARTATAKPPSPITALAMTAAVAGPPTR
jgi:hypothetical protein